jgi:hypothetical protein
VLGSTKEPLNPFQCLFLVDQMAEALDFARAHGALHLRLNTDRVTVGPGLSLHRIYDLGLAELFSVPPRIIRAAPLYAAPEQLRDGGTVDERADMYAVGMLLYELLTLKAPFCSPLRGVPHRDKLLLLAATELPEDMRTHTSSLPEFLDVYVRLLGSKNRDDRPATWQAFREQHSDVFQRCFVRYRSQQMIDGTLSPAEARALKNAIVHYTRRRAERVPRSGEQPTAGILAAFEGYELTKGEQDDGVSEPEWMQAVPAGLGLDAPRLVEPPPVEVEPLAAEQALAGVEQPLAEPLLVETQNATPSVQPQEEVGTTPRNGRITLPSAKIGQDGIPPGAAPGWSRCGTLFLAASCFSLIVAGGLMRLRESSRPVAVALPGALASIVAPPIPADPPADPPVRPDVRAVSVAAAPTPPRAGAPVHRGAPVASSTALSSAKPVLDNPCSQVPEGFFCVGLASDVIGSDPESSPR